MKKLISLLALFFFIISNILSYEGDSFKWVSLTTSISSDKIGLETITIIKGDFIGIYGPSGSGKSTFIKIICGLLSPEGGKISIDDK